METQKVRVIVTIVLHPTSVNTYVVSEPHETGVYGHLINLSCQFFGQRRAQ